MQLHMSYEQCDRVVDVGREMPSDSAIRRMCREWVTDGEWDPNGEMVPVWWSLRMDSGDEINSGNLVVTVEPDHDALIRAAGGDDGCDHRWVATVEDEGGCNDNPGVWSAGGTTMVFRDHCSRCGLRRERVSHGTQRDPGQADEARYSLPDGDEGGE